jgi:ankyrin repeat protein
MTLTQSLLSQGVDINGESDIFGLPLLSAAYGGHMELVLFLLEQGADPNGGVIQGNTKEERRHGRMFTSLSQGWTALEAATAGGHEAIVDLLLNPNIGISSYSYCSFSTAIIHAARWGRKNILQILLDRADLAANPEDLKTGILDAAASESASNGRIDILTLLLDAGAQVNRCKPPHNVLFGMPPSTDRTRSSKSYWNEVQILTRDACGQRTRHW